MKTPIEITRTTTPRQRVATSQLGFGKYFADHMFTLEYEGGAWKRPQIIPYGPISMEPGASVLHYGQALFEGMKAFRGKGGKIHLFRPAFHARRFANGAKRLCMPSVPEEIFLDAIEALVKLDESWIPNDKGAALYLRPTLIGTESFLGVRPSEKYLFFVINSPVGAYYAEGFNPVKIWIEEETIRAAPGGLGSIKAAANYAASLLAGVNAKKKGYAQVLWLDAIERRYVEEVGTMNVFFRIGDEVITPPLGGTILAGATRDCVLQILKDWNMKVTERPLLIDEVFEASAKGTLKEVFGSGTAAVISSVGELASDKRKIIINEGRTGELTQRLFDEISAIQYGEKPDLHGWVKVL